MKVIIAGSRSITNYDDVALAVYRANLDVTEVVSGGAKGVDRLGEAVAYKNGVPVRQFIPDWDSLGKKAGYVRNTEMGEYADALIAIWDGQSKGTKHMIDIMNKLGKPVHIEMVKNES